MRRMVRRWRLIGWAMVALLAFIVSLAAADVWYRCPDCVRRLLLPLPW